MYCAERFVCPFCLPVCLPVCYVVLGGVRLPGFPSPKQASKRRKQLALYKYSSSN